MNDPDSEYVEYVRSRIPALRRLALLLCGDDHRADDLVQTTITKLYVNWARAQAANSLNGYVRSILVRTFVDERRLGWARVRLFGAPPEPEPAPVADEVEDRAVLRTALARVPRRQRAVLVPPRKPVRIDAREIRDGWAVGEADEGRFVRWNVDTGEVTEFPEFFRPGDVTMHGWVAGPKAHGGGLLRTGTGTVDLPGLAVPTERLSVEPVTISDDGRTIAGTAYDESGITRAVTWRCS